VEKWIVPDHMKQLANKSTTIFGYDIQGTTTYNFNELGFRTGNNKGVESINLIGNSIAFGIGLEHSLTFGSILASNLSKNLNNISYGCYLHENHDHLSNIELLTKSSLTDDIFVVQINNLDRRRVDKNLIVTGNDSNFCKTRFLDYFDQVTALLKYKRCIFLYWDDKSYDLPKSVTDQFLIYNKFHLDNSMFDYPDSFGIKSNLAIAKILTIKAESIQ
jgi:hypothetical protein